MTARKALLLIPSLLMALCSATPTVAVDALYTQTAQVTLPSTDTWWDYIKMQPGSSHLFMARVDDGLTVFDVDTNKLVTTIDNSIGANGPLLLPEYGRGYVAMTDGSLLIVDLETLKPLKRLPLADDGGLNSAIYDPVTKRVYAITSTRKEQATWFALDAATGKFLWKKSFPFRKMDDAATDGKGTLFAPARYDNIIMKLKSDTLEEFDRWTVSCNVKKVYYQAHTNRVFGACSGDKPTFFVLDADTGREIANIKIGKGIDAMVIDEKRHRILASNDDGSLNVIGQNGADDFKMLGTIYTSVGSRMMHIDQRTGRLFVVNAGLTITPPDQETGEAGEVYHPNSFTVTTYTPQ
ncbi:MAG: hypothetical protein JKY34_10620 [Kordiimonadaceae bacterium]|nr:hypothetical protein [Kordiimonadaceae bacterium]